MNDQAQRLRELARSRELANSTVNLPNNNISPVAVRCKSIAVTSGKGGVGKTNIALSLAVSLASLKKKVLLLDADLGLANVHILLGLAPRFNLSHFLNQSCTLEQVIIKGIGGVDILPGASGLEEMANLDLGRLELLQHQFQNLEEQYDYMIIDTGAGIGANVIRFASRADLVVLVMSPEPTSLADAYAMVKVLYEKGARRIQTLVNMAVSERDGGETFDRLNALVVKFLKQPLELLGILLFNREIPKSVRRQRLIVLDKTGDGFSVRIAAAARKLSGVAPVKRTGYFRKFW